ncbi:MAG: hypothetical protein AAB634_03100 [Patescibacteria group bacterium]
MSDLSDFSVDELAAEVRRRVREDEKLRSFWPDEVYGLMTEISVIPCVDCLLVRQDQGKFPELGFSIRNTGFYAGKKWMAAGGRINRGESLSGALKRHVKTDLGLEIRLAPGLEWNVPILVSQHGPEVFDLDAGEFAGDERSKCCTSNTYLVVRKRGKVVLGEKHGGKESGGVVWCPADALPPDEEIAYGGQETIRRCAAWALLNL